MMPIHSYLHVELGRGVVSVSPAVSGVVLLQLDHPLAGVLALHVVDPDGAVVVVVLPQELEAAGEGVAVEDGDVVDVLAPLEVAHAPGRDVAERAPLVPGLKEGRCENNGI